MINFTKIKNGNVSKSHLQTASSSPLEQPNHNKLDD